MKYLFTFLVGLLAGVWIYDIAGKPAVKCPECNTAAEVNTARWEEKHRWMNYELDSIRWPALKVELRLLASGNERAALDEYRDLIKKVTTPYHR